jgi:hypothetical protein
MDKKLCIMAKSIPKNIPIPIFKTKHRMEHILQIVASFESESGPYRNKTAARVLGLTERQPKS